MQSSIAIPVGATALCAALLLAAAAAAAAESAARFTAVAGDTTAGADRAVEALSGLADDEPLETGEDGGCSLLLEEDALVELCGGTSLALTRNPAGRRIVRLDRGEARIVVEPRTAGERIEIHTPAAIATILGTVVHVSVDALGVTTITSSANRVQVTSNDPSVKGSRTIGEGERVVIEPGKPPSETQRLSRQGMAGLGGCLVDFHGLSLVSASARQTRRALDLPDQPGPDVGAPELVAVLPEQPDQIADPPFEPNQVPGNEDSPPMPMIAGCGEPIGDFCGF